MKFKNLIILGILIVLAIDFGYFIGVKGGENADRFIFKSLLGKGGMATVYHHQIRY